MLEKRGFHLIWVSESIKEELSVTSNGTSLFFVPTLTISGNLINRSNFSSLGYVCNVFLLTQRNNIPVVIIAD